MKIFISADIEGVNNIVSWDETDHTCPEYHYFRKQMTNEVSTACTAIHETSKNNEILHKKCWK